MVGGGKNRWTRWRGKGRVLKEEEEQEVVTEARRKDKRGGVGWYKETGRGGGVRVSRLVE